MIFRKRTARGRTLLQKGFPPGPSFRKLPLCAAQLLFSERVEYPHLSINGVRGSRAHAPKAAGRHE